MRQRLQMISQAFQDMFKPGRDPYKPLAAYVMGKTIENVTVEERHRMKEALWLFFTMRGPDIITNLIQGEEESE